MGLRDEQRELTRRKVLDAVIELVAEGSVDSLSVPDVARRSGVSVATIYRHFSTRDDLIVQASLAGHQQVAEETVIEREAIGDDYEVFTRAMWARYSRNLPLLRHQIGSEVGRELRRARLESGRAQVVGVLDRFGIDSHSEEGRRLLALILLVTGSAAIIDLCDRQGLDPDDAVDMVMWATRVLGVETIRLQDGEGPTFED